MSILLSLFLKLSAFSLVAFGGVNALLPVLLNLAVNQEHWIDLQTFSDYFAIAQAAPGPNFMTVTLLGWHIYGVIGALVATLAISWPSSIQQALKATDRELYLFYACQNHDRLL